MNVREYRSQVEAALLAAPRSEPGAASAGSAPDWQKDIAQLSDPEVAPAWRQAAVQRLQTGTFLGSQFAPFRAAYIGALRTAATSDDSGLRQMALDCLANLNDDFARQRLVGGLRGTEAALVAPAVALGLLARDDHASVSDVARSLLTGGADIATRTQAARLLAVDPASTGLLSGLMRDKMEFREVRRASAVALRSLDPGAFVEVARSILADTKDFSDIKATVQGALDREVPLAQLASP